MNNDDNSFAKILIADAIRTQDQQRMRNELNQKLNEQESENAERIKKIEKEKAEKENLLMWAKEEDEILSNNLVIQQGSPLDEAIFSKSKGRNYYWMHLLNHILNGGAGMSNLKVQNDGSFFNPNKTAFVNFSVPYPKDNYFPMYNFSIKHLV